MTVLTNIDSAQISLFDSDASNDLKSKFVPNSFVEISRLSLNEVENLAINYSFQSTRFGKAIVASTQKGICYLGFFDDPKEALAELDKRFSKAQLFEQAEEIHQQALLFLEEDWRRLQPIRINIYGTDFQLKVWDMLLKIPLGTVVTYGNLADELGLTKGSRAVGTAIGRNPVAFLIPCHRVVQSSGGLGGYMWGINRKKEILHWERT